jgi:hypothetical protein
MNLLLALIPDEALILVIVAIGFGLMLGIIRGKAAASMIGGLLLFIVLGPFVEALLEVLPWWLTLVLLGVVLLSLLRAFSSLLLGSRASDHMVGILAADVVRFCFLGVFQILLMPFRIVGWLLRRGY